MPSGQQNQESMSRVVAAAILLVGAVLVWVGAAAPAAEFSSQTSQAGPNWYKGNTHAHTLNSDGDSTPNEVVNWYREQRYHFLFLTDHNYITDVDGLNGLYGAEERFIVIKGEEVSSRFEDKPIHVNGLNVTRTVGRQQGSSVLETLQRNIDGIRAASGVPHINHPNFRWAITTEDLKQVQNTRLFEIFNGNPGTNNLGQGGGGPPSLEQMWDSILSSGKLMYGIAVDDAHVFKDPWAVTRPRPGTGWVMVRARRLTPEDVLDALELGNFYATTGVTLMDYQVTATTMTVAIEENPRSKYSVIFVGQGGRVLKEDITNPAVYEIQGDEGYVRAKVLESWGYVLDSSSPNR